MTDMREKVWAAVYEIAREAIYRTAHNGPEHLLGLIADRSADAVLSLLVGGNGADGKVLQALFREETPPNGWTDPIEWDDFDAGQQAIYDRVAARFLASLDKREDGWRLPEEPTREMWAAMGDAVVGLNADLSVHHDRVSEAVYRAALSARPQVLGDGGDSLVDPLAAPSVSSRVTEQSSDKPIGGK